MKNFREILKSIQVELTDEQFEQIKDEMNENYVVKNEYTRMKDKFDKSEQACKDIQSSFDEFKKGFDGVDVDELKARVDTLTNDLSTQKDTYEKTIKKMELDSTLEALAKANNCKDFDLAKTQLDYDKLMASKNQKEDAEAMFNALKESKPLLFETEEPKPQGSGNVIGGTQTEEEKHEAALRSIMGLD